MKKTAKKGGRVLSWRWREKKPFFRRRVSGLSQCSAFRARCFYPRRNRPAAKRERAVYFSLKDKDGAAVVNCFLSRWRSDALGIELEGREWRSKSAAGGSVQGLGAVERHRCQR